MRNCVLYQTLPSAAAWAPGRAYTPSKTFAHVKCLANEMKHLVDVLQGCDDQHKIVRGPTKLQSLWAGYGTIYEIETRDQDGIPHAVVVKEVNPPHDSGISHERKLKSYQVEASFYQDVAPFLLSTGLAIPTPLHVASNLEDSAALNQHMHLVLTDLRGDYPARGGTLDMEHAKAALSWLAHLHACYWQRELPKSLWSEGCFWALETRMDEWNAMEKDWATLKAAAHKIANDLHTSPFRTLVHGDAKTANFLFGKDAKGNLAAAAYDFQYTGGGDGMKDIAYLITSSVQQRLLPDKEEELLRYYYERLKLRLSSSQVEVYTWEVAQERYSLAVADFVRFMAGWGWWGATGYAEKKTRAFIQSNYSCDVQA